MIKDPTQIANAFNDYFTSISTNYQVHPNDDDAMKLLQKNVIPPNSKFSFQTIDLQQLERVINELNLSKFDNNDSIPSFVFKDYFSIIGPQLLKLINKCIACNTYPDFLKIATVSPIYKKKGDKKSPANYRPISVLPTLSKIVEKVLYNQLVRFFEQGQFLHCNQFGFRRKKSTIQAIHKLTECIYKALDQGIPVASLHFDFAKAFDLINHKLLLKKLSYYLHSSAVDLIASYLRNRKQRVKIDSAFGPVLSIVYGLSAGVPQGSILGPLLFIIFVNDMPGAVEFLTYLFADDTTSIISGPNLDNDCAAAEHEVSSWCAVNGLMINQEKTQRIDYKTSHQNRSQTNDDRSSKSEALTQVNSLGIIIDETLNWSPHVLKVTSKINSMKWALRNLSKVLSLPSCLMYYHANIISHLRYGLVLWGLNHCSGQLFIEQKKCLRLIFNKPFNSHCKPLFIKYQLLTLPSIFILDSLKFAIDTGLIRKDMIKNMRNPFINYEIVRLKVAEQSVSHTAIRLFNNLPLNLRKALQKWEVREFMAGLKALLVGKAFYSLNDFFNNI